MATDPAERMAEYIDRYEKAQAALEAGIYQMVNLDGSDDMHPHSNRNLCVSVSAALVNCSALVKTLVDAGVITHEDYFKNLCEMFEDEVRDCESVLSQRMNRTVKLK